MESGRGKGMDIESHNLEYLFMPFNVWKDVIIMHPIKIGYLKSLGFCCQVEVRLYMRWSLHYYKDDWPGLFSFPFIVFKYHKERLREKIKYLSAQYSWHGAWWLVPCWLRAAWIQISLEMLRLKVCTGNRWPIRDPAERGCFSGIHRASLACR